ncbi:hypothetical protein [Ruminiclostridium josui]|nr:hypothetical protein [Ruminiclostridium josui]
MNKFSKKKKIIIGNVLLIAFVLLAYILIDQLIFFTNKPEITGFINKYMQSIEGINMLSTDYIPDNDIGVKNIADKKITGFRDFYKKYYFANDSNNDKLKYIFNSYDLGIQNMLNKKGELKKLDLKSFKIISIFKIPFASHITVKLSYKLDYKVNGSMCFFSGTDILEIQSASTNEEISGSNHIQTTFYLKKVKGDWKISRIPRSESTNISDK